MHVPSIATEPGLNYISYGTVSRGRAISVLAPSILRGGHGLVPLRCCLIPIVGVEWSCLRINQQAFPQFGGVPRRDASADMKPRVLKIC